LHSVGNPKTSIVTVWDNGDRLPSPLLEAEAFSVTLTDGRLGVRWGFFPNKPFSSGIISDTDADSSPVEEIISKGLDIALRGILHGDDITGNELLRTLVVDRLCFKWDRTR
jgi:hypothetical protein